VQQIQIEIVSTETGEASVTSMRHGISSHLIGFHLGDHEGTVTLTGNHAFNQFLRTALTVISRCVNQCHAERKARSQRLFFFGCRMSSLPEMPKTLTNRRDDGAVMKLYCSRRAN
jgi:hypothetical protein